MSTTAPGAPTSDSGTIDALKRIKATEVEWEHRVADARQESERTLQRMREETDAAVQSAHAAAEADHRRAVEQARAAADAEARTIVAGGEQQAAAALRGTGQRVSDRADEILAVVLGGFAAD